MCEVGLTRYTVARYTPEPIQNWADYMDEEEAQENHKPNFNKKQRYLYSFLVYGVMYCCWIVMPSWVC